MKVTLSAVSTVLGERITPLEEIAAEHGMPLEKVQQATAELVVYDTRDDYLLQAREWFVRAAKKCLEEHDIAPDSIDCVIALYPVQDFALAQYIQLGIGANRAFTMPPGGECPDQVTALCYADMTIRRGLARRVLVVGGALWGGRLSGVLGTNEPYLVTLHSDGVSAAIVEADGPGPELLGFGFGSAPALWGYKTRKHMPQMSGLEMARLQLPAEWAAAERCLESAGITRDQVNWFAMPGRPLEIHRAAARRFRIPQERALHLPGAPSALGVCDVQLWCDGYQRQGLVRSGDVVLLGAWNIGTARLVAVRYP